MRQTCLALAYKWSTFEDQQAPAFFVIYAHDQPNRNLGKADDRKVKEIIHWLDVIGSKASSDRNPILQSTDQNQMRPMTFL